MSLSVSGVEAESTVARLELSAALVVARSRVRARPRPAGARSPEAYLDDLYREVRLVLAENREAAEARSRATAPEFLP